MNWLRGALLALATAAIIAFGVGFLQFTNVVRAAAPDPAPAADAIVALTGARGRLETAVRLLREDRGQRLFISGVNPEVRDAELYEVLHVDADLAARIDIGRAAADTLGNASETADWARSHDYDRIILVTDDFHMPRSAAELKLALPGVKIVPYPVPTRWTQPGRWNNDPRAAARLGAEYVKYLLIRMREGVVATSSEGSKARKTAARTNAAPDNAGARRG
ncbi:MAG: YdcF family protein [Hyphomonadaceae bacterium]|nr:YdcF family protein [Hyphomonadaceae bacterium]